MVLSGVSRGSLKSRADPDIPASKRRSPVSDLSSCNVWCISSWSFRTSRASRLACDGYCSCIKCRFLRYSPLLIPIPTYYKSFESIDWSRCFEPLWVSFVVPFLCCLDLRNLSPEGLNLLIYWSEGPSKTIGRLRVALKLRPLFWLEADIERFLFLMDFLELIFSIPWSYWGWLAFAATLLLVAVCL